MIDNNQYNNNLNISNTTTYPPINDTRKQNIINDSKHRRNYKKRKRKKKIKNNNNSNGMNIYTNTLHFFKVATLNIRQLNDIKVQNLAKYLEKNDIDILSITETRISNKNLKFITKNKFMNHQVFGTVGAKFNESGTLIIVKKELAKHISKLENYKGRVLKIEFTFSEQHKLAIISVYNKSGDRGKDCIETRIDINKEIMRMIKDSKKKNQQIILMGDFNLQYRKYLQQKNSNRTRISEQLKIFDLLKNQNYLMFVKKYLISMI